MISQVISGGQTGADIAGLRAAKFCRIPTGGWMPKNCVTLDGRRPEYLQLYGMCETPDFGYPKRTRLNVACSDFTIQFAEKWNSPGEKLTTRLIEEYRRPSLRFDRKDIEGLLGQTSLLRVFCTGVITILDKHETHVLNIAGNSEQTSPGIEHVVFSFLVALFTQMKEENGG